MHRRASSRGSLTERERGPRLQNLPLFEGRGGRSMKGRSAEMSTKAALRASTAFLFVVAASQLVPPGLADATKYEVTIERGVAAKMRDGVTLRADIYRPKADGQFPVLLVRTPYDKQGIMSFGLRAAKRGYVVVAQDVRGRFTSEGEWYPFKNESLDGYDTVEWAAALPYSNGKVGMLGGSYVGATQYLAAIAKPPHLAGICPTVTASNYHDGWTYQSGAFEQWFDQNWTTQLATNTLWRLIAKDTNALIGAPTLPLTKYPSFNYDSLPAGAASTAELAPY